MDELDSRERKPYLPDHTTSVSHNRFLKRSACTLDHSGGSKSRLFRAPPHLQLEHGTITSLVILCIFVPHAVPECCKGRRARGRSTACSPTRPPALRALRLMSSHSHLLVLFLIMALHAPAQSPAPVACVCFEVCPFQQGTRPSLQPQHHHSWYFPQASTTTTCPSWL